MATMMSEEQFHVPVEGTRLFVVQRGGPGPALILLHGGPGLDHHAFADYLDPLADRYRLLLVDQRAHGLSTTAPPETWTIEQMARDVVDLAAGLGLDRYAVLGHSFGGLVALQHAVDFPGAAAATIIAGAIPSPRYLSHVEGTLAKFKPPELREQLVVAWARERVARTADDVLSLLNEQLPFNFANPADPRIEEYSARLSGAFLGAEVLRHFARQQEGGIDVEARLPDVPQPVLVIAGRHDRIVSVAAARAIAQGVQRGELALLQQSGHMGFVEENEDFIAAVRGFLDRVYGSEP